MPCQLLITGQAKNFFCNAVCLSQIPIAVAFSLSFFLLDAFVHDFSPFVPKALHPVCSLPRTMGLGKQQLEWHSVLLSVELITAVPWWIPSLKQCLTKLGNPQWVHDLLTSWPDRTVLCTFWSQEVCCSFFAAVITLVCSSFELLLWWLSHQGHHLRCCLPPAEVWPADLNDRWINVLSHHYSDMSGLGMAIGSFQRAKCNQSTMIPSPSLHLFSMNCTVEGLSQHSCG